MRLLARLYGVYMVCGYSQGGGGGQLSSFQEGGGEVPPCPHNETMNKIDHRVRVAQR